MVWIFVALFAVLSSAILYASRRRTKLRVYGLNLTQFYHMAISAPLVALSLINIGLEIINRPQVMIFPFQSHWIFSLYALSTIIGVVGTAIHSISATMADDFPKGEAIQAQQTNEIFHGPLSHGMTYMGGIFTVVFLALLELNHPDPNFLLSPDLSLILGVILGLVATIGIIWSTYIASHFLASLLATSILLYFNLNYIRDLSDFPLFIMALTTEGVLLGGLLITLIIFRSSSTLTRKFIKFFFPNGHPYHS